MVNIKDIAAQAKKALDKIENGKTFSSSYVLSRLEKAAENNSGDALICHMRDVIQKTASSKSFITQKEIGELYDKMYGLSGGRTNFRKEAGDLLPAHHAILSTEAKGASSRIPYEKELNPLYGDSDFSKELAGVFSLDKKASFTALSDNTVKKAEKFAKLQLNSVGCTPQEVKAIKTNQHFVLCNASVDTSDFTQVNIPIPVQVTNGIPALPSHFIQGEDLVKLNKENIYVFIKDKNNFTKKAAKNKFSDQRSVREFKADTPVVPASLEKYANLEDDLVAAASNFSRDQIKVATNVVAAELAGFGIPNPQVRVFSSDSKILTLAADLPTPKGRVILEIPVDMPNGRPVIPNMFRVEGKLFNLDESGLSSILAEARSDDSINKVSRDVVEMSRLSYSQLLDRMIDGVSTGNYKQAEDALSVIGDKFEGGQYLAAFDKFSKLLKHSSDNSDRAGLIKQALSRGDLIRVPTSVQPYCPKLGLPVSKVDFDKNGKPIPMRRNAQDNSLESTGAMISSSKIALS